MPSKSIHGPHRWRAVFLGSIAAISAVLILRGLHLGYDLSRPVPYYDQWEFVRRIGDALSGRFGFADLVAQHNDHRIATARAVFLLDLWLADGTGYLSTATLYLALAAIAAVLARCVADQRGVAATVFLLVFGLFVSPAQWENLSSGFQVQFPFVDLFSILALSCLIAAMTNVPDRRWTRAWMAAASTFDVLAVFSMASGTLLVVPALWIGLVVRRSIGSLSTFVALHLVACALFAFGYVRVASTVPVLDPILLARYALVFMGAALRTYPHGPFPLGLLDALCLAGMLVSTFRRSRGGGGIDRVQLLAISVALLLMSNAVLTAVGRSSFGVSWAASSRYSIQSLVLQPTLLIALWRESRHWRASPRLRATFGASLLTAGIALSLLANLSGISLDEWRDRIDIVDRAGFALAQGLFDDEVLRPIYPAPESIRKTVAGFAAQRLGPFSARYSEVYRSPLNLLAGIDLDAVDRCTAALGFAQDGRLSVVNGWAFDPKTPTGDGLIVVLDRSEDRRIVGYGRQTQMRPDVDRALNVTVGRSGFQLPVRLPSSFGGARSLTLLVIPERAGQPACATTVDVPATPPGSG